MLVLLFPLVGVFVGVWLAAVFSTGLDQGDRAPLEQAECDPVPSLAAEIEAYLASKRRPFDQEAA